MFLIFYNIKDIQGLNIQVIVYFRQEIKIKFHPHSHFLFLFFYFFDKNIYRRNLTFLFVINKIKIKI